MASRRRSTSPRAPRPGRSPRWGGPTGRHGRATAGPGAGIGRRLAGHQPLACREAVREGDHAGAECRDDDDLDPVVVEGDGLERPEGGTRSDHVFLPVADRPSTSVAVVTRPASRAVNAMSASMDSRAPAGSARSIASTTNRWARFVLSGSPDPRNALTGLAPSAVMILSVICARSPLWVARRIAAWSARSTRMKACLLYTSDAADE